MDGVEVRSRLYDAARLRMPRLKRDDPLRAQIEELDDYLRDTAIHRGELEEARLYLFEVYEHLSDQWDLVEIDMPANATNKARDEERKALAPETALGMKEAKHLIARVSEQISRLEIDDRTCSRRYTLLTGGS